MGAIFAFVITYKIYFIVALVCLILLLIGPVRRNLRYLTVNVWGVLLYGAIWVICSAIGVSLAMNAYALAVCAVLGIPGVALVMFLNLFSA